MYEIFRTGSSPTTYALLGHSSTYYGTAPSSSATPTHGQVSSVVGPVSTHSSVYQFIVYTHTPHQYHHGTIHNMKTRTSVYAQSPHHASPSLFHVENRHHQQQDWNLKSLNSAIGVNGGNGATGEIGVRLDPNATDTIGQAPIHTLAKYSEIKGVPIILKVLLNAGSSGAHIDQATPNK